MAPSLQWKLCQWIIKDCDTHIFFKIHYLWSIANQEADGLVCIQVEGSGEGVKTELHFRKMNLLLRPSQFNMKNPFLCAFLHRPQPNWKLLATDPYDFSFSLWNGPSWTTAAHEKQHWKKVLLWNLKRGQMSYQKYWLYGAQILEKADIKCQILHRAI